MSDLVYCESRGCERLERAGRAGVGQKPLRLLLLVVHLLHVQDQAPRGARPVDITECNIISPYRKV